MGAHNFEDWSHGKDATVAYNKACEEATWENGHDAYNGTISTTHGCSLQTIPDGVCREKFVQWVLDWDECDEKKRAKIRKKIPTQYHSSVSNCSRIYEGSKFSTCLCFEVTGKKAKEYKIRHSLVGKHVNVYQFLGWAAE